MMGTSPSSSPDPRDRQTFVFHETALRRFLRWALMHLFRIIMRLEVRGLEHVPADGALVAACNHVTNFDVIPLQLALPRVIFFMGKAELFNVPLIGPVFRNAGAFPVRRGENDAWAMQHAAEVLAHAQTLGMFPEGHRSKGSGLGTAKTGAARLAMGAGCPILPVAIVGSDGFFKRFPHRARVSVTFLPPLMPQPAETPANLTQRVMLAIASALPEVMRGSYRSRAENLV
jgi:1-acyl-sn-glycerol-3-phosphate acyltransferase